MLQNGTKNLGEGAPYRAQGPLEKSAKFAILPFWPIFGPACGPDLDEYWQTVYNVLYVVQFAVSVPSFGPIAHRVGEI